MQEEYLFDGVEHKRARVTINRRDFLQDRQGRTFADVLDDPEQPLDAVLEFFSDEARQRRMEESEIHHDRPPLAGVVRELEAQPPIDKFLSSQHPQRTKRLRQAVGVVVRIVMERRGWKKTGKKGSLGVRLKVNYGTTKPEAYHNTGGLAFWFLRAERYKHPDQETYPSVRDRARKLESVESKQTSARHARQESSGSPPRAHVPRMSNESNLCFLFDCAAKE